MDGEYMVKTCSEMGYFWPTPMPGGEQWVVRAKCLAILRSSNDGHPHGTFREAYPAGRGAVVEEGGG